MKEKWILICCENNDIHTPEEFHSYEEAFSEMKKQFEKYKEEDDDANIHEDYACIQGDSLTLDWRIYCCSKQEKKNFEELEACPYCGSIPTIRGVRHEWVENVLFGEKNEPTEESWWVSCETEHCPAYHMMEYPTKDEAIKAWNKRATADIFILYNVDSVSLDKTLYAVCIGKESFKNILEKAINEDDLLYGGADSEASLEFVCEDFEEYTDSVELISQIEKNIDDQKWAVSRVKDGEKIW